MCAQRTFCPLLQIQRSATPLGAQTRSTVEKLLSHAIWSGVVVTARCLPAVAGRRVFRAAPRSTTAGRRRGVTAAPVAFQQSHLLINLDRRAPSLIRFAP